MSQISPYNPTRCSYDNSPFISLQPEQLKASVMANGRMTLSPNAEAYFETSYTNNKITSTTQQVPIAYNAITTAQYNFTAATRVCCSMTSDIQMA